MRNPGVGARVELDNQDLGSCSARRGAGDRSKKRARRLRERWRGRAGASERRGVSRSVPKRPKVSQSVPECPISQSGAWGARRALTVVGIG